MVVGSGSRADLKEQGRRERDDASLEEENLSDGVRRAFVHMWELLWAF